MVAIYSLMERPERVLRATASGAVNIVGIQGDKYSNCIPRHRSCVVSNYFAAQPIRSVPITDAGCRVFAAWRQLGI